MDPTLQGKLAVLQSVFRETIILPLLAQRFVKLKAAINAEWTMTAINEQTNGEYHIVYMYAIKLISLAMLKSHRHR